MVFWLLIALILLWALAIPAWPYHEGRGYGYYPFALISTVLLVFILLWWLGLLVVAWPR